MIKIISHFKLYEMHGKTLSFDHTIFLYFTEITLPQKIGRKLQK